MSDESPAAAAPIGLRGALWLTVGERDLGGAGRIALLASIARHGSITQAAKAIGISYKGAWDAIDTMDHLAGEPLIARATGGRGGGGTQLTARGQRLVENFQRIEREHAQFVEQLSRQAAGLSDDCLLIRRMGMKTSARNQFFGTVRQLRRGAVNDEVELEIAGGHRIVAVVTHDSVVELGLAPGAEAFALVKASSILLASGDAGARYSARNQLTGTIACLQPGAVNTEVSLDLAQGQSLAAIVTNHSSQALELAPGQQVSALFKASSVILAVPA